jgi:uncharacterized protein (TIGR02145 family)
MSKSALFIGLMFFSQVSFGQNISVTFSAKGAATQIDSVTATNLRTNQSVTLPGNETLVLAANTGITSVSELAGMGIVFPNPFSGKAMFTTIVQKAQTVYLKVQNLAGQVIAQTKSFIQPGENEFALSLNTAGFYMVSLTTDQGTAGYKVICTGAGSAENSILYVGSGSNNRDNHYNLSQTGLKSSRAVYVLVFALGDIIRYTCTSGNYTTILTNSPTSTVKYEVELSACSDPDGKNYSIVKTGNQTWMAENMDWLPSVSPGLEGSETSPYYYVYDYEGTSVSDAKATVFYSTYGVLYNWAAASNACPSGWHLPTYGDWSVLVNFLKNNGYGYDGGEHIAKSLAATWGWRSSIDESAVGYQATNNSSGFNALAAGSRSSEGHFHGIIKVTPVYGETAQFWTATPQSSYPRNAYFLGLYTSEQDESFYWCFKSVGFSVRCLRN